MNCTRFQGKETDVVQIKDLADTLPFFSDYRLIIVENYARISRKNNRFILNRGADPKKDQSYFLWRVRLINVTACISMSTNADMRLK